MLCKRDIRWRTPWLGVCVCSSIEKTRTSIWLENTTPYFHFELELYLVAIWSVIYKEMNQVKLLWVIKKNNSYMWELGQRIAKHEKMKERI